MNQSKSACDHRKLLVDFGFERLRVLTRTNVDYSGPLLSHGKKAYDELLRERWVHRFHDSADSQSRDRSRAYLVNFELLGVSCHCPEIPVPQQPKILDTTGSWPSKRQDVERSCQVSPAGRGSQISQSRGARVRKSDHAFGDALVGVYILPRRAR